MFEVSLNIDSDELKSYILKSGKIATFDNCSDGNFKEILRAYCLAGSQKDAIAKVLEKFSICINVADIEVREIAENDSVFNDWLMCAIIPSINQGEIEAVINQCKI